MRTVGLQIEAAEPLSSLRKEELIALAAAELVDVDAGATKAEIIAAIEAHRGGGES